MRQYVRAWINEWDLRRLDPSYEPEIEAATLEVDLSEDAELEGGEAEGGGIGRATEAPGTGLAVPTRWTWRPRRERLFAGPLSRRLVRQPTGDSTE